MRPIITGLRLMTTTNPMSVNILVIVMAQAPLPGSFISPFKQKSSAIEPVFLWDWLLHRNSDKGDVNSAAAADDVLNLLVPQFVGSAQFTFISVQQTGSFTDFLQARSLEGWSSIVGSRASDSQRPFA
jgi:hypothetical protein